MVIVSFWLFILALIYIPLQFTYKAHGRVHDTIRAFLDRGQEPPAAVIDALRPSPDRLSYSPRTASGAENLGVLILCLGGAVLGFGIILGVALWLNGNSTAVVAGPMVAGSGFIVGMIGLGLFIVGRARRPRLGERDEA